MGGLLFLADLEGAARGRIYPGPPQLPPSKRASLRARTEPRTLPHIPACSLPLSMDTA